jgi:synaptobrevin family protein YKT6
MVGIDQVLAKYQNPTEADKVLKIQKELEETKQIVVKNIDQLLERGEKLDDLAQKSNDLSFQSKAFASRAEDLNRCCVIL